MRAQNLAELLDHETPLEKAFTDHLEAYLQAELDPYLTDMPVPVFNPRSESNIPDRLAIIVDITPGPATQDHHSPPTGTRPTNTGFREEDLFTAELVIYMHSARNLEPPLTHRMIVGTIRAAMLRGVLRESPQFTMPFLSVADFSFAGQEKDMSDDRNQDISILRYMVTYGINPDAWPLPDEEPDSI